MEEEKYTRVEYERRFLVPADSDWRRVVEPYAKTFEDKYLRDARLRLRVQTDSDTGQRLIKLTKKAESASPYFQTISRILLSAAEFDLLNRLEGDRLTKVRHYHADRGRVFSIDVFEGELEGLVLCEAEAEGWEELMSIEPPEFAAREVTEDLFFTGGNLCRVKREELQRRLAAF